MRLPCRRLPREVAQLLGTIRNAAYVAPLGNHLSIRLQQCLNDAVAPSGLRVSKRWWFSAGVDIPAEVLEDIATLYHSLDDNDEHPVWQSYIGFLLAETINQRRKWQQPKDKTEPYTTPMFYALRHDVTILRIHASCGYRQ